MSFDWKLYITLAEELINYRTNSDLQEACLRSSISRGYYGVYCIARNFLIKKGKTIPKTDSHKFVREEYQNNPSLVEKKIAKNLKRLLGERKEADYDEEAELDLNRARTALLLCQETLQYLKKIGAI